MEINTLENEHEFLSMNIFITNLSVRQSDLFDALVDELVRFA